MNRSESKARILTPAGQLTSWYSYFRKHWKPESSLPAPGIEPGPYRLILCEMCGGLNHLATRTDKLTNLSSFSDVFATCFNAITKQLFVAVLMLASYR